MIVFLQNAAGFFIQFFPCALMIFLPFPKEAYRFSRRSVFIGITAASAIMSAAFSAVLCLRDIEAYPRHVIISNSFMTAAILLILAAYVWLVRESLMKKVMVFFIVLFYAATEFVAVNAVYAMFYTSPDTTAYPYTETFLLLYAVADALLLPLMIMVVIRPLREYISQIEPQSMKREFVVVILSTLVYFAMAVYFDTVFGEIGIFRFYLPLLLFMMLDQMLIFWLVFRESVRRKHDTEQHRAMEIRQLQYEMIVGDMENTRRMRHDLRHHYNALNDMLDQGQLEEMKDYLSKVINTTVKRDSEIYCENMTVNGLLQYYVGMIRDQGIACEVHAECGSLISIEPADLTVLLGNAMENAVNACKKCGDDRWVNVNIGTVQGSLAIEISNSCKEIHLNRHYQTADGFSPAEAFLSDREGGGYGLRSITHTAQKYDGSAKFRFDAEKEAFTARIRLNMHKN